MRDIGRIFVIGYKLIALWQKTPDQRFFQFIENLQYQIKQQCPFKFVDFFYLEDGELGCILDSFLKEE
jgi:hypothetical protein